MASGRRIRRTLDIWPGFVDALATLVMVVTFVFMVFALAQFFLTHSLSGRDATIGQLSRQLADLGSLLDMERKSNAALRNDISQLTTQLQASTAERERLSNNLASAGDLEGQLKAATGRADEQARQLAGLQNDIAALTALRDQLEKQVREQGAKLGEQEGQLASERKLSEEARAQAALLNSQLEALRQELSRLGAVLGESEKLSADQKVQIADLGKRLNAALASKVEELSKYRSEFFGRLRQVLGNRPGVRIEGDRFVFQSELLFATGASDLGEDGQKQMTALAATLKELAGQIPKDVNWVLRVDGHTDKKPIATPRFPSNWELSTARAVAVVKFLMAQGIAPERLAAAGFGEYQPIDGGDSPEALQKNRRIELRLDQR